MAPIPLRPGRATSDQHEVYNGSKMLRHSPRQRFVKTAVVILSGMAILSGVQLCRWHRRATETFKRHADDLHAKETLIESRTLLRPALFKPVLEGDAWDSYALLGPALKRHVAMTWKWPDPRFEEHVRLLAESRPILDGLRQAFSKDQLTLPETLNEAVLSESSFSRSLMGTSWILLHLAGGFHSRKRDAEALDSLILMLAMSADLRRIRGYGIVPADWSIGEEDRALVSWRSILEDHSLGSSEIAGTSAQLDRLLQARPSIHDPVAAYGITWRQFLLDAEREGRSDFPFGESPSWRYAFSARLGRAVALDQTETVWKRLQELKSVPSHQWKQTLETIYREEGSKAVAKPFEDVRSSYLQEAECLRMWTSLRVAMAIARYEVERGHFPATLSELSPDYLESIPSCPEGGEALLYKPGEIWCIHSGSRWKVGRNQ
jgi:hypothetical protein